VILTGLRGRLSIHFELRMISELAAIFSFHRYHHFSGNTVPPDAGFEPVLRS